MSSSKPAPLYAPVDRKRCPVCGEVSYSRHGVHPQCSQRQADDAQKATLRERAKVADAEDAVEPELKAWHRRCPRCRAQVHVRKHECDCGYAFPKSRAQSQG